MVHMLDVLSRLEPVFLLLAGVVFLRSGSVRQLPAVACYFAIRGISALALNAIMLGGTMSDTFCGIPRYTAYFYTYWGTYLVSAVAIFFIVQEVFKRVMEPVPGLRRLGLLAFRWIMIVSVVVSVGAIALPLGEKGTGTYFIQMIGPHIMRCVSIMELCLLAFLALSIHTLGRSFRSRLFGIGLALGVQAAADLISSALIAGNPVLSSTVNLFEEVITLAVLAGWAAYFLVPEPAAERRMIVLPPSSVMSRWNALAKGIGQTPDVAVAGQPTGFFLQDIEGVVDRVLAKNPVVVGR